MMKVSLIGVDDQKFRFFLVGKEILLFIVVFVLKCLGVERAAII